MDEAAPAPAAPPPPPAAAPALPPLHEENGALSAAYLEAIHRGLEARDAAVLKALTADLHESDTGALLEALPADDRPKLITLLGNAFDFTALTEVAEGVRTQIIEDLPTEVVVEGVRDIDTDDAVYILEDLEEADKDEILARIPPLERTVLERALDYPEESAGRRMQGEFIAVPPNWTVGKTIDFLREDDELPHSFYEIFVVDPGYRLLGSVALDQVLRSKRPIRIDEIMTEPRTVAATEDQEQVARVFERYNLVSVAVVDTAERLVGVLTFDDILDVVQEEAEEDFRALAGVGDEEVTDSVVATARSRFPWLVVNLATAFAAAGVIALFRGSIEQMVALAVLMPIVASMGGNAGNQAVTVTVRALAMQEFARRHYLRVVTREALVGLLNGVALALLLGAAAGLWFQSVELGFVIAIALVVNLVAAGVFGAVVPLTLAALKADPAVASTVFVTTATDVIGFFAFLGLAAWWFGLSRPTPGVVPGEARVAGRGEGTPGHGLGAAPVAFR